MSQLTPEERAALERLRRIDNGQAGESVYGAIYSAAKRRDEIDVIAMSLRDHPADADDPITPEWLGQQPGWKVFAVKLSWEAIKELPPFNHSRYTQWFGRTNTKLKLHDDGVLVISQGQDESIMWPVKITTRGQLRGLLKEIGA